MLLFCESSIMYTIYNAVRCVDRVLLGGYVRYDGDLETASCLCFGAVAGERPGSVRASLFSTVAGKRPGSVRASLFSTVAGKRPGSVRASLFSTVAGKRPGSVRASLLRNGSGKETGQRPGVSVTER